MKVIEKIESLKVLSEGINPTIIYNEGWMVRLLVMQSIEQGICIGDINFGEFKEGKYTSEALIESPFMGPELKKEHQNETNTHMDIVIGDFKIDYEESTGIEVDDNAKILGIIEAKMGSDLSQKITNADDYNQVSRSICCLAYKVPAGCKTFVIVVAPQSTLKRYKIDENDQLNPTKIRTQIDKRLEATKKGNIKNIDDFNRIINHCRVLAISFEDWIDKVTDSSIKTKLQEFYDACKKWNRINA
ncbi:MAG: hypothetical protein LBC48_01200 [Dysgonamonadaceae bacterium]|jgi:hypothetical protein|nr:hypothetical protein [Dysgonamonadaceae bacterium]